MRKLDILLLMGVEAVLLCAGVALASRNSSGTMSAINGPYVAGTVISSSVINARLADIETEMTSSLDRSGRGAMLAKLQLFDGTTTAPGLTFGTENTAGLYRAGSGDLRMTFNGTNVQKWQSTGSTFALPILAPLGIGVTPNANAGLHVAGGGGSWSTGNIGKQIIIDNVTTSSNPAIGIFDSTNANPWAIVNAAGTLGFYTMPALTDSVTAPTKRFEFTTGGVNGDTTFKHKRFGASCSTLAVAGNTCTSTLTWVTAFADANYTVVCTGQGPAGVPLLTLNTHVAASATINVTASTAVIASFTEVDCIAVHD